MLVVTRKNGQKIMLNDDIEITVVDARNGVCKIAIQAPRHVKIYREEIYMQIKLANLVGQSTPKDTLDELASMVDNKKESINNSQSTISNNTEEIVIDDTNNNKKTGRIFINKKKPENE